MGTARSQQSDSGPSLVKPSTWFQVETFNCLPFLVYRRIAYTVSYIRHLRTAWYEIPISKLLMVHHGPFFKMRTPDIKRTARFQN